MTRNAYRLGALALALSSPHVFAHRDAVLGKVAFPVSCNSEAAHFFEEGMLLQYNYHWGPARKAFEAFLTRKK
jgi:hypothetical protein